MVCSIVTFQNRVLSLGSTLVSYDLVMSTVTVLLLNLLMLMQVVSQEIRCHDDELICCLCVIGPQVT